MKTTQRIYHILLKHSGVLLVFLFPLCLEAQQNPKKKLISVYNKEQFCFAPGIGIGKINNGYSSWYAWNMHVHSSWKKIYLNYNYSAQKELQLFSKRFDNVTRIRALTTGYKYSEKYFAFMVGGGIADVDESQYLSSPGVILGNNMFRSIQPGQNTQRFKYSLVFESQLMFYTNHAGVYLRMFNMSGNSTVPFGFSGGIILGKLK